ncbi:MAG: FAD binding domain-containing protein [Planctomycetota bacterium]
MMRLPAFRFEMPESVEDAAAILAEAPQSTRLVAGGTDLWPNMKRRHQGAETVVSLAKVRALFGVRETADGGLVIGAMTSLTDLVADPRLADRFPGLARAIASISSPVLRNMGTIGGNLCLDTRCTYYNQNEEWRRSIDYCMKEKGEVCWVAPNSPRCWAVSSTDSAPAFLALGASVTLVSAAGARTIPLEELYVDDGINYLAKRRDEILTEIHVPAPGARKTTYWKLRRRGSIDYPVLGVACSLELEADGKTVKDVAIWLGAVRSAPVRAAEAEDLLRGQVLGDALLDEAAKLARKPASPLDNTDYVHIWRAKMVERYVVGILRELSA